MARSAAEPPELRGFSFLQKLGAGGFSDVFLYDQELPRRKVAVKVLLIDELAASTRAAFVSEANVMAQLSAHPYIVSIFHADVSDDGRPYFIMEYCSGPNLADRYKQAPFSVAEALRTGVRLSSAIATAHAAGILHRDIKPANVLTNDYGWPALTDFGIASAVEDELPIHTTTRAALLGEGATTGSQSVGMSVPWSPPEMFDDDPRPDVRSDIFSLAATIYTLLAGRTPFEVVGRANQSLDLMSRIERGAVTPMDRTDVPASLLAVLRKGMSVDRAQRYATAVDFAQALQRVELELGYAPTPIDVPNQKVAAPERTTGEDPANATRARGVSSVVAQPPTPPAATEVGATRVRTVQEVAATPGGAQAPVASTVIRRPPQTVEELPADASRPARGRVVAIVVVAIVLVVAAIVAVVLFVPHADPQARKTPSGGSDAPLDLGSVVPTPVAAGSGRSPDGSAVTFTWTNPDPREGDSYLWQRTDGAGSDEVHPTETASATVTGVAGGTTVCISVQISRAGELSADPLKVCNP